MQQHKDWSRLSHSVVDHGLTFERLFVLLLRLPSLKKHTHAQNTCCRATVNLYIDLNLLPVVAESVVFSSNTHTQGGLKEAD